MDDGKSQMLKVGLGLVGIGVILALLGGIAELGELGGMSGMFVFFGLVIMLIAAFRGGSSQQQQQQIVVVQGDGNQGGQGGQQKPAVRCPDCGELNPMEAAYCGNCGKPIGKAAAR